MKIGFRPLLYLMATVLLATGSSARAQAPDICWRAITLAGDAPVELRPAGDEVPELRFRATSSVIVELPGTPDTPQTIPAGEIVHLDASSGRVEIRKGPLELISANGRYAIPLDPSRLNLRLSAIEGTKIRLPDEVTGGKLPANKSAEVIFEDGPVQAQLVAPVSLKPVPPADPSARLEVGALPITRGGRTLQVELDAPGWNQDQLSDEIFQACFYDEAENDQSASTSEVLPATIPATMASVVSARDGRLVLTVPVPDEFDTNTEFYHAVQLQILGPTLGVISSSKEVWIGNPIIAFIGSVGTVIVMLVFIAYLLPSDVTIGGVFRKLFSFTIGLDSQPSLSLFQMYIWTALVLVGMFYVFLMSGDLLNISQQVLVLVGLAGLGSISARWTGTSGAAPATGTGFWGMFVVDGKPDLLRLQLFLFTLAIWIYVAVRVFYEQEFPELDPNVLLLMGISNGVYVGAKWAATGDPTTTLRKLRLESDALRQAEQVKADELKVLEGKVAELTDATTKQPKAGKEQEHKAASAELEAKREELKKLTESREKAETDYKAEIDRLGKA